MDRGYPLSVPVRTGPELAWHEYVDARVRDVAMSFGAREAQYSALIATEVLAQAEYPRAFPHLLLVAGRYPLRDTGVPPPELPSIETTEWCLSPAVCYHVYAQLAGSALREPIVVTARGACFRHECEQTPGVRQVEFAMREVVLLGAPDWVNASAPSVAHAIETLARELGLEGDWRAATDPFFLPMAEGKAALQRLAKTKHEYQQRDTRLALASVNRHGTFFSQRFHITAVNGRGVHSACIAVGLDRWCHAARPALDAARVASAVEEEVRS